MAQKTKQFKCSECRGIVCSGVMYVDDDSENEQGDTERDTCFLKWGPVWRVCENPKAQLNSIDVVGIG